MVAESRGREGLVFVEDRSSAQMARMNSMRIPRGMHLVRAIRGKGECEMTPYTILSSGVGTQEASDLSARLSAWHDAMVAHERRLRSGVSNDSCDDECPHAEARTLWPEALSIFGARAHELAFLRLRAQETRRLGTAAQMNR